MSKGGVSIVLTLSGPLAQRLKAYLKREWPGQQMGPAIMRKALREFLERELRVETRELGPAPEVIAIMRGMDEEGDYR